MLYTQILVFNHLLMFNKIYILLQTYFECGAIKVPISFLLQYDLMLDPKNGEDEKKEEEKEKTGIFVEKKYIRPLMGKMKKTEKRAREARREENIHPRTYM